jgi:DNA-binding transcriptional regulator YdaS (Cro superfamily)
MSGTSAPPGGLSAKEFGLYAAEVGQWIWGTTQGAFNHKQTTSQIITDAVIGMIPVVGDVTAVRDLIAVSMTLINEPEKRSSAFEWILLIILIFALVPVIGGVIKGVGRLALRITPDVLRDSAQVAKIAEDLIAFLNRVGHKNAEAWIKGLNVIKYERELLIKFGAFCDTMVLTIFRCKVRFKSHFPDSLLEKLDSIAAGFKTLKTLGERMIPRALKELHQKLEHIQKVIHSGGLPPVDKSKTLLAQTGQKTVTYAEEARLIEGRPKKRIVRAGKYKQNIANVKNPAALRKVYNHEDKFPDLFYGQVKDPATGEAYFNMIAASSGKIKNEMLSGETLFRAFGPGGATHGVPVGESFAVGAFWGRGQPPKTAKEWREQCAVLDEWNRNGWLSIVNIPPGVEIPASTSTVSEQFGKKLGQYLPGGGQQAVVTDGFDRMVKDATKRLFARGGGKETIVMANGKSVEVIVKQSGWKGINGKVGYGDEVIPGAGVAERLGLSEHQVKLGAEGARQVAHGGVRRENAADHGNVGH